MSSDTASTSSRPTAHGKFISINNEKFFVKGITYGSFKPLESGVLFPDPLIAERDLGAISKNGFNTIRTYTVPPQWLLDAAQRHGIMVMTELPWTNFVAFLNRKADEKSIVRQVRNSVQSITRHPAILCYSLGNEIPAPIVRYYGNTRIESFIGKLYDTVKSYDPEGLVTYVNYPTTEYLYLPFLDIASFNVYLESIKIFESYLARLHNIAFDRPLMLTETGLDSRRNGLKKQAETLDWQARACFASGCAGMFVFQWTDEWYKGTHEVTDWDFGLTTRNRRPKPALKTVSRAYSEIPYPRTLAWPKISVIVCTYNGSRTIGQTLDRLSKLEYPNYEMIVINDGSTDETPAIVSRYARVRLVTTKNNGLSKARNRGCAEATGDIVAYIDDDAYPDPHWLNYIAATFLAEPVAGVGGPNILPPESNNIEQCVDKAPGNPIYVLVADREAEHITGCNMAFKRDALNEINGFDEQFWVAGDDVDLCWRIREKGWKIGFHPGAVVWHHRRNRIKTYLKQQFGYGKAEAMLERKWPEKYNRAGHISWAGRLYGKGLPRLITSKKWLVYHGMWGSSLFQSLYEPEMSDIRLFPLMPEWYLMILMFGVLSLIGLTWDILLYLFVPLFAASFTLTVSQAVISAWHSGLKTGSKILNARMKMLIAILHFVQPIARLAGRIKYGLSPWRLRGRFRPALPGRREYLVWSESWRQPEHWLTRLYDLLISQKVPVMRGNEYDRWDLQVSTTLSTHGRLLMMIEEHGNGKQMLRFKIRHVVSPARALLVLLFMIVSASAFFTMSYVASALLGCIGLVLLARIIAGSVLVASCFKTALEELDKEIKGSYDQC